MLRGIWGDPRRYDDTYWSRFEGRYFAGDGAKLDDDGYLWLLGRVDDVMNVSGHRISTTEVESALVSHPAVAEAAVVGATDATTGQAIFARHPAPAQPSAELRTTSRTRSERSPSRRRSSSPPIFRRRDQARSCGASYAMWPRVAISVIPARLPMLAW
jgi:acyl-coenzyme A synthetase/AMP-(fatty) acid ligase